jgi:hypothetical protein
MHLWLLLVALAGLWGGEVVKVQPSHDPVRHPPIVGLPVFERR